LKRNQTSWDLAMPSSYDARLASSLSLPFKLFCRLRLELSFPDTEKALLLPQSNQRIWKKENNLTNFIDS
jgi:hypothetical protein